MDAFVLGVSRSWGRSLVRCLPCLPLDSLACCTIVPSVLGGQGLIFTKASVVKTNIIALHGTKRVHVVVFLLKGDDDASLCSCPCQATVPGRVFRFCGRLSVRLTRIVKCMALGVIIVQESVNCFCKMSLSSLVGCFCNGCFVIFVKRLRAVFAGA